MGAIHGLGRSTQQLHPARGRRRSAREPLASSYPFAAVAAAVPASILTFCALPILGPGSIPGCTASDSQCRITTLAHPREKGARRRNSPWAAPLPVSRVAPSRPASSIASPRSGPRSQPLLPQLLPAHLSHSPPFRAWLGGRRPAWSAGLAAGTLP
jgi:hypothetical protein